MDTMWKRVLVVLALGLILPQMIVHFGSKEVESKPLEQLQQTATKMPASSSGETEPGVTERRRIPVLVAQTQVVQMELEEYVRGVVLAEMPVSFGMEALKAQAIAARTYALRRITYGDRHTEGAVCANSTCCQAWMSDADYIQEYGTAAEVEKVRVAVEETAGLVVTYDSSLAETTYYSCSGGRTESAAAVWNWEIPYLQAVDSPGEETAPAFFRMLYFTAEEFAAALGRSLDGSPEVWFGTETRTPGGGVATLVVGGITYSGVELRRVLSLPSTAFTVTADQQGVTIHTRGHGHRVGMSQYGAGAMAEAGADCFEILAHYYPGTEIDKIEQIG